MAIKIEVVSDSDAAKRDLSLLKNAIDNIKKAASSFSFSLKSDGGKGVTDDLKQINAHANTADASVARLRNSFSAVGTSSKDTAANFRAIDGAANNAAGSIRKANEASLSLSKGSQESANGFSAINSQLSTLVSSVMAAGAAYASFNTFDKITNITSQLKLATNSQNEFNIALEGTRRIAIDSRTGLFEVNDLYSRIARATTSFSRSQNDVLVVTQATSKAISLYGANAQDASAAILQLGQALSSGHLGGDELRSIMENAPGLATAIADGLGVSIGKLKELGAAGSLTSKQVFGAILQQSSQINENFQKAGITFSQAFGNIGSSLLILLSSVGSAMGGLLAPGGKTLPEHINQIAIAIKVFADNIEWMSIRARSVMLIMMAEIYDFVSKPLIFQISFVKAKLSDMLPSSDEVRSYLGGFASFFSPTIVQKKASGGRISGPGTGTSDSIPAMLSNGEFVVNASATSKNSNLLHALNSGAAVSKFAEGGLVGGDGGLFNGGNVIGELIKLKNVIIEAFKSILSFLKDPAKIGSSLVSGTATSLELLQKAYLKTNEFLSTNILPYVNKAMATVGTFAGGVLTSMANASPGFAKFLETTRSLTRTGPYTGGGPYRNPENRTVLHDVVNTFVPEDKQMPVLLTATGAVAAAIIAVMSAGPFRSTVLGLMTTGAALVINSTVKDSTASAFQAKVAESFLTITKKVTDTLFGSGIFGERGFGGTLMLITKLSMLFSAGRAAVANGLIAGVTAPTSLANNLALRGQVKFMEFDTSRLESKFAKVNIGNAAGLTTAQTAAASSLSAFTNAANTAMISARTQASILANTNTGTLPVHLEALANAARNAATNVNTVATANAQNATAIQSNITALQKQTETLRAKIGEQGAAFKQGTINTASGIGGIFGSLAGFNIGSEIAKGMTGSSEWLKVGVTLGSAMLGQAIVATFAGLLTAALFSPLFLGLAAVGALLYGAFKLFMNWDGFVKWVEAFKPIGLQWAADFIAYIKDKFPKTSSLFGDTGERTKDAATIGNESKNLAKAETPYAAQLVKDSVAIAKMNVVSREYKDATATNATRAMAFGSFVPPVNVSAITTRANEAVTSYTGNITSPEYLKAIQDLKSSQDMATEVSKKRTEKYSSDNAPMPIRKDPLENGIESLTSIFKNFTSFLSTKMNETQSQYEDRTAVAKATGGRISGPGSGTSDSIPAMLSNGEFVINAKDSEKNADILHAINNGKTVKYFSGGNTKAPLQVYSNGSTENPELLNKLVNAIRGVENAVGDASAVSHAGAVGLMQMIPSTFNAFKVKANAVITNPEDNLAAGKNYINYLWSKFDGDVRKIAAGYHAGEHVVNKEGVINPLSNDFKDKLNQTGGMFTTAYAEKVYAKVFGGNGKGPENFDKSSPTRGSLISARKQEISENTLEKQKDELFSTGLFGGMLRSAFDTLPIEFQKGLVGFAESARKMLNPVPTQVFDVLSGDMDKIAEKLNTVLADPNATVSKESLSKLGSQDISSLREALTSRDRIQGEIDKNPDLSGLPAIELNKALEAATLRIKDIVSPSSSLENKFSGVRTIAQLTEGIRGLGAVVRDVDMSKITSSEVSELSDYFKNLDSLNKTLSNSNVPLKEYFLLVKKENEEKIRSFATRITPSAANTVKEADNAALKAGADVASGMQKSFGEGLSSLLKGKSSFKDVASLLVNQFTGSIIDSAVNSFTSGMFARVFNVPLASAGAGVSSMGSNLAVGKDGLGGFASVVDKAFKGISDSLTPAISKTDFMRSEKASYGPAPDAPYSALLPGQYSDIGASITKSMETSTTVLGDTIETSMATGGKGLFSTLQGLFSGNGVFSQVGSMFSTVFSGIRSFVGFADGGHVNGPGSGTSDSIPAMLSNGEFVINAKSTSKHRNLLERINSGNISKFAEGGIVGAAPMSAPAAPAAEAIKSGLLTVSTDLADTKVAVADSINSLADGTKSGFKEVGSSMNTLVNNLNTQRIHDDVARSSVKTPGVNWLGIIMQGVGLAAGSGAFGGDSVSASGIGLGSGASYRLDQGILGNSMKVKFATGGTVNGAGTGTSDSIPAMLSNGEFVVNARAAKTYSSLLSRINSNSMPRFAEGGFVGDAVLNAADIAKSATAAKNTNKTQSTFNINVTGDISLQTRKEIQQMIPEIASGVNSHNYERGNRR